MVEVNRGHQESPENSVEKAERFMAVVMQIIGGKLGLPLSNNFGEMTLQVRNECKRIGIPDEELDEMIADAMKEACTLSEFRVYGVSNHNSSQLSSLIMPRDDKSVNFSDSDNNDNKSGAAAAVSDQDKINRNIFNSMEKKDNDVQRFASEVGVNEKLPRMERQLIGMIKKSDASQSVPESRSESESGAASSDKLVIEEEKKSEEN